MHGLAIGRVGLYIWGGHFGAVTPRSYEVRGQPRDIVKPKSLFNLEFRLSRATKIW